MLPIARTSEATNRKGICPAQGQRCAVHSGRDNMDNTHIGSSVSLSIQGQQSGNFF